MSASPHSKYPVAWNPLKALANSAENTCSFPVITRNDAEESSANILTLATEKISRIKSVKDGFGKTVEQLLAQQLKFVFDNHRVHIHRFRSVTPARRYRQRDLHSRFLNLPAHTADSATRPIVLGDDDLCVFPVRLKHVFLYQFRRRFRHVRRLLFQAFMHFLRPPVGRLS